MERELSVLVIEDDQEANKRFEECAATMDKIEIVACTNDSGKGIDMLKEYRVDAVILDLELNDGVGSGLEFLADIPKTEIGYKPFIVVTSNNSSKLTVDFVRSKGIDYYFSKHKSDYSEKAVLGMLESMKDTIQGNIRKDDGNHYTEESGLKREKRIRRAIKTELDLIGISPKAVGYKYLTDAIYLLINGEERPLATVVGEIHKKSNSSVERAMQNAIDKAWRVNDTEELLEHYKARIDPRRGAPTLTEFIYYYANKVREM